MAVTQSQAQKLVDEHFRPNSERVRAAMVALSQDLVTYGTDYPAFFAPGGNAASSTFADNRQDVPHNVSAQDVVNLMAMAAQLAALATPTNLALLDKFCVQPLQAS